MEEDVKSYIYNRRHDFVSEPLTDSQMPDDPLDFFEKWFDQAIASKVNEPNAMSVATVDKDGKPSVRVVYLRNFDRHGLVFFTNYNSLKGSNFQVNPYFSANFYWPELSRQVRFDGSVLKISDEVSDEYFASRPRGSQIGAWASNQSSEISSRKELEDKVEEFTKKFEGRDVPRPPHWGGYLLQPNRAEFWQGRPSRLHDRIAYQKSSGDNWITKRLSP